MVQVKEEPKAQAPAPVSGLVACYSASTLAGTLGKLLVIG